MILFIDCEGTIIQEFTALCISEESGDICSVLRAHVKCLLDNDYDYDAWARRHGQNLNYLAKNGLKDDELLCSFRDYLQTNPYRAIFVNGPLKEKDFLNVRVHDVQLPPWKTRADLLSLSDCSAHSSFLCWKLKNVCSMSPTDIESDESFLITVACTIVLKSTFTTFLRSENMTFTSCHCSWEI